MKYDNSNRVGMELLIIVLVYTLSQGVLLVISGYWWDDALVREFSYAELCKFFNTTGALLGNLHAWFIYSFKEIYRIIVFVSFGVISIIFWAFLRHSELFDTKEAFWITLLFTTMPINDARITLVCFGYTLHLLLFVLVMMSTVMWKRCDCWGISLIVRLLSWVMLFVAYGTNSILVFTGLLILWLWYIDLKDLDALSTFRKAIKNMPRIFLKNLDYIIIPCVYWKIKNSYFRPYGNYTDYNAVSAGGIFNTIIKAPINVILSYKNVFVNYYNSVKNDRYSEAIVLMIFIVSTSLSYFCYEKKTVVDRGRRDWLLFFVGIMVFFMGFFPYSVVRNAGSVSTAGVGGRDSLLLGFGMAISLYFGIKLFIQEWARYICLMVIIVSGMLYFNIAYLKYQEEWYESLEFMNIVRNETDIKENDTFCVYEEYQSDTTRFYVWNINAAKVLGNQTRRFSTMYGVVNESILDYKWGYGMNEYDGSDPSIDGILILHNQKRSVEEILRLKYKEEFRHNDFVKYINNLKRYEYINITPKLSDVLIENYSSGYTDIQTLLGIMQNSEEYGLDE